MRRAVRPGVTTFQLDQVGAKVFRRFGARSGPQLDYGFPGVNCISVNDEAVHGIPSRRRLRDGDLVKLDVTAELNGFYADACATVPVGRPNPAAMRLAANARRALERAIDVARGRCASQRDPRCRRGNVTAGGHAVCTELMGHGIGRRIHESQNVPNHYIPSMSRPVTEGLVLTIELIISAGTGAVRGGSDGWTIKTADGALAAHAEHTLVITRERPLLLTA